MKINSNYFVILKIFKICKSLKSIKNKILAKKKY